MITQGKSRALAVSSRGWLVGRCWWVLQFSPWFGRNVRQPCLVQNDAYLPIGALKDQHVAVNPLSSRQPRLCLGERQAY